ncbi:MAG: class I SAM-dependent methyltransferase [Nocardioides sp.]
METEELLSTWRTRFADPVHGWDFGELGDALIAEEPPWSYADWAATALRGATSALDMGTGGGEVLAGLADSVGLPADTVATEGWAPNLPVAREALAPLGVEVVAYDAEASAAMPFPDGRFDAVLNRHEAFVASEVARLLKPGGRFLTQQVDGRSVDRMRRVFGGASAQDHITLDHLTAEVAAAGLQVERSEDWVGRLAFADVETLIGYLRMVPWEVPDDFTVDRYAETLLDLHRSGDLEFEQRRFVLLARRP